MQLACRCQRIEQALKEANCSKLVQDWIAEQTAKRTNNGYNESSRQPIVNSSVNAAPVPANSNSTSRMARISQPCVQMSIPAASTQASSSLVAVTSGQLTKDEMEKLKKFNRCFNCKGEGHTSRNCTRPVRPFLAVSALLQGVTIMEEDNASESGKA